ncbi:MAG: site-specific DNA-methyltransferase, partial [Clostridiales bacterium]|nr:site-specific DNA-methyltransferase [Clostridiales bacterium]
VDYCTDALCIKDGVKIDPPYNTGNDFIYDDSFRHTQREEDEQLGLFDEDDNRLFKNTDTNGRFHSDWCSMIYPRLVLARNLLSDDGVIFISIDDNEQENLKKICDEVFGGENYVQEIIWIKKFSPQNDAKYFSLNHESVLCYAKYKYFFKRNLLPPTDDMIKRYKNLDNDPRGVWTSGDCTIGRVTEKDYYPIKTPSGREVYPSNGNVWRFSKETFKRLIEDNRIWFGENGDNMPRVKRFLSETNNGIVPTSVWSYEDVGHTQSASQELKKIFDNNEYFDYPKPVGLVHRMGVIATDKDSIILDFFSGSATTAHAVMQLNAEEFSGGGYCSPQIYYGSAA